MNLAKYKLKNCPNFLLVFIDGIYKPEFSDSAKNFSINANEEFLLNVKSDISPDTVLHLLFLSSSENSPKNFSISSTIEAAKNSEFFLLEEFAFSGNCKIQTRLLLHENAKVNYTKLQKNVSKTCNLEFRADLNQDSILNYQNIMINSGDVYEKCTFAFHGNNGFCDAKGLYDLHNEQNLDFRIRAEHLAKYCQSKLNFKGIIDDKAKANFIGRIIVPQNAIKTESSLSNKNLLLSDNAIIQSAPELEIYANDVKCTHGSAVGQLDKQMLFYLQTRGFAKNAATEILLNAFKAEIIEEFPKFLQEKLARN